MFPGKEWPLASLISKTLLQPPPAPPMIVARNILGFLIIFCINRLGSLTFDHTMLHHKWFGIQGSDAIDLFFGVLVGGDLGADGDVPVGLPLAPVADAHALDEGHPVGSHDRSCQPLRDSSCYVDPCAELGLKIPVIGSSTLTILHNILASGFTRRDREARRLGHPADEVAAIVRPGDVEEQISMVRYLSCFHSLPTVSMSPFRISSTRLHGF